MLNDKWRYYIKNATGYVIPKILGNLLYFGAILTLLIITTVLVVMVVIEFTFSNIDKVLLYLLGAFISLIVMVFVMKYLERVQFVWKVLDLDALIKRRSTKEEVLSTSPNMTMSGVVGITLIVFVLVLIVLIVAFYMFATIFVEGDITKAIDYFIN